MGKAVIIACDFKNKEETLNFLNNFKDEKLYLKIGMELFYSEGPEIVREIKKRGHNIFLDLKLHDIPNTVEKAMKSLASLDVDMTNVHASGTIKMMEAPEIINTVVQNHERIYYLITSIQMLKTVKKIQLQILMVEK